MDVASALFRELASLPLLGDDLPAGVLNLAHLRRAVSHEGGLNRLRCFAAKLRAGNNVSIAVLGGSVSAGSSSRVRPDQSGLYHRKLQRWLQSRFPGHVGHINAAMPAVPPGYMEQCLSLHVPPTVDLVLLEASANMCGRARREGASSGQPDPCELGRESVERMLRQVLGFPSAPAVVFVHAFPFWTMETPKSWYARWPNEGQRGRTVPAAPLAHASDLAFSYHKQWGHTANEDSLEMLARYYDLPSISLRNVIWHAMKANRTFGGLRLHELYYDRIHPSNYGHAILAHGLVHLLKTALLMLELTGAPMHAAHDEPVVPTPTSSPSMSPSALIALAHDDAVRFAAGRSVKPLNAKLGDANSTDALATCARPGGIRTLPPQPMLPNVAGAEARRLECHDADSLHALVEREGCIGWAYAVERSPSGVPKPGWLSAVVGAQVHVAAMSGSDEP